MEEQTDSPGGSRVLQSFPFFVNLFYFLFFVWIDMADSYSLPLLDGALDPGQDYYIGRPFQVFGWKHKDSRVTKTSRRPIYAAGYGTKYISGPKRRARGLSRVAPAGDTLRPLGEGRAKSRLSFFRVLILSVVRYSWGVWFLSHDMTAGS